MPNRNDAGKAIDPGVVQAAAGGNTSRQSMIAQNLTPNGGTPVTRILQARRPTPVVSVQQLPPSNAELSAAQEQQIPGVAGAWMGPLNPLAPSAPGEVRGRALDMMVGWNVTTNNQRMGQLDVTALRALARNCDMINLAVDMRKDELESGQFDFKLRDDQVGMQSKKDPRIQELRDFFRFPDRRRPLARWIRKWSDDLLVVDAPCVWIRRTRAGKPYEMRVIDTAKTEKFPSASLGRNPRQRSSNG